MRYLPGQPGDADRAIAHIPLPLVSRFLTEPAATTPDETDREEPTSALRSIGISVVVPTRDRIDLLLPCIESLIATAGPEADFEIIIVDNGTTDAATSDYLRTGQARGAFRVVPVDEPFNWARLNNLAARHARNPILLFLNNDTECLTPGWDREIADLFADPMIGVAGARLLYDDHTIQHGGIIFGFEQLALHDGRYTAAGMRGPEGRWMRRRAASAVTGACLATPRELFERLGGFDERRFAISYNDVDYCLRVRAVGKLVAYDPRLTLLHHESKSRGLDSADPIKQQRDEEEARVLRVRWGKALDLEPSVNPHWARFAPPFTALAMPSIDRITDYIRQSARPNPWLVEPVDGVEMPQWIPRLNAIR
jgi:GT2 family glycosyltransferase